jgi:DNA (cytosine-5)-methyltransferase 1
VTVRLLDLFCGAGGAAMGYHGAGFEVVGVDIKPQPRYPFEFIQADALEMLRRPGWGWGDFDAIHASPPCQFYASLSKGDHWRSIPPTRELLEQTGLPYVIENIGDAAWDMREPVRLCGSMFGLNVRRHRLFESSFPLMVPSCHHGAHRKRIRAYYGKKGWLVWTPAAANVQRKGRTPLLRGSVDDAPEDMGIDWMKWDELREAIPPAYTELIGHQLMQHVKASVALRGGDTA